MEDRTPIHSTPEIFNCFCITKDRQLHYIKFWSVTHSWRNSAQWQRKKTWFTRRNLTPISSMTINNCKGKPNWLFWGHLVNVNTICQIIEKAQVNLQKHAKEKVNSNNNDVNKLSYDFFSRNASVTYQTNLYKMALALWTIKASIANIQMLPLCLVVHCFRLGLWSSWHLFLQLPYENSELSSASV